jgi:hypothetical protein
VQGDSDLKRAPKSPLLYSEDPHLLSNVKLQRDATTMLCAPCTLCGVHSNMEFQLDRCKLSFTIIYSIIITVKKKMNVVDIVTIRYVGVIWFAFHVLQLLLIRLTQQNLCYISNSMI